MGISPVDVCLASLNFYPDYSGAALRFQRYAPRLRARGIRMRVFAGITGRRLREAEQVSGRREAGRSKSGTLLPSDDVDGIPVQRVQIPDGSGRALKRLVYHRALADYCWQPANRPDLLQMLSLPLTAIPFLFPLRRLGIPIVFAYTMVGEMSARRWKRWLQRRYWPLRFRFADVVVVNSTVMRNDLRALGVTGRIEVIPNGLDLNRYHPLGTPDARRSLRERLGLDPDAEVIIFVGSISRRKGLDTLVEAWNYVAASRPRALLVLVGPNHGDLAPLGPDTAFSTRISTTLARVPAKNRLVLTGMVKNVEEYLQAADVFVLPSRREGMSNAVLEAFGCGLASILTPHLGLAEEFGRPGEHYSLAERIPEALAAAIDDLLDDPERRERLGCRARALVEKTMDVEQSLDRYADLYRELTAGLKKRKE